MTRRSVLFGAGAAGGAFLAACSGSGSGGTPVPSGSASGAPIDTSSPIDTESPSPTDSESRSPSPSETPSESPSAGPSPSASPGADAVLRPGASGPDVLALQQRLDALGLWVGAQDGKYGAATMQAVFAAQKLSGIGRDGLAGPKTRAALDREPRPTPRSTSGTVVEVDLDRQVLMVVDGGTVRFALNTSTGSGQWYARPDGTRAHAVTPRGHYQVFRWVDGWDSSPLGELYRPRYFNGGIAVHGYPSVPSYPASHGCVRVGIAAMDMIWRDDVLPRGTRVWVY